MHAKSINNTRISVKGRLRTPSCEVAVELTLLKALLICELSLVGGEHCCFALVSVSAVGCLLLAIDLLRHRLIDVKVVVVVVVGQRVWLQQPFLLESALLILRETPHHLVLALLEV